MNLFAGLVLCTASFAADPVGVSFNESLVGFGMEGGSENDTLADYLAAYEQGKALNKSLGFSLHVDISDIKSFIQAPRKTMRINSLERHLEEQLTSAD